MILLKPSKIEGIGVFSDSFIAKGRKVFTCKDYRFEPFKKSELDQRQNAFYERYCVEIKNGWWTPKDFERMHVSWFLNHSSRPNIATEDGDTYFALRDIKRGRELLIDYKKLDKEVDNSI